MNTRRILFNVLIFLILTACSSGNDSGTAPTDTLPPPGANPTSTIDPAPAIPSGPISVPTGGAVGRIAYETYRDGSWEIFVVDAGGANPIPLTNHRAEDKSPAWSPDASRIAFTSDRDRNVEIYVMNADGTNHTNLTNHTAEDTSPAWSPDGKRIAFTSDRDGSYEIYVMYANGSNPVRLTNSRGINSYPAWSPDGERIAFHSRRDGNFEIYVMDADGENPVRLTNNKANETHPVWSPDGGRIAYVTKTGTSITSPDGEIYLMDAGGGNQIRLTDLGEAVSNPTWSPDGQSIAFSFSKKIGDSEIFVIDPSDGTYKAVDVPDGEEYSPAWASDEAALHSISLDSAGLTMVSIPAGTYTIGADPELARDTCSKFREGCEVEWFLDEGPIHQVELNDYFIDQYEVTNASYADCVADGVCQPPKLKDSATRDLYFSNPVYDDYPVINVPQDYAAAYCEWRGGRLPTEAEWEVAARGGSDNTLFPWGNAAPVCEVAAPNGAKFDDGAACDDTDTEPVGSYPPNAFGLYDMAGNVSEWTADWYNVYPGGDPALSTDFGEVYRVVRGGSWYNFGDTLRVAIRFGGKPDFWSHNYGFRCAADQPSAVPDHEVFADQEPLKEEWRPALQISSLLMTTCEVMYVTANGLQIGLIDINAARLEFSAQTAFLYQFKNDFIAKMKFGPSIAHYKSPLGNHLNTLLIAAAQGSAESITPQENTDRVDQTCVSLLKLEEEIWLAAEVAGLSPETTSEIYSETSDFYGEIRDTLDLRDQEE